MSQLSFGQMSPMVMGGSPQGNSAFPDPWSDMSSLAMPETMAYALRWCEYIAITNGTYLRALDRVLSYFLTNVEVMGIKDSKTKDEIKEYLYDEINIMDEVHTAGLNYMVYGNDFTSVIMPFRRYIYCERCKIEFPLKTVFNTRDFNFSWNNCEFHASCPRCKYSGEWKHIDRRSGDDGKIHIKHWSPHEMDLLWDPYTEETAYIWKIPEDYRKVIRDGHLHHLERASWEVIQAVKTNSHLRFNQDVIYHMREATMAGIRHRGWGISRILSNFRQAWYVQVLQRYNEAIALDYVIPFRVITPASGPGSGDQAKDALMNMNMGGYMAQIQRMLRARRKDPATWHTLPFAVEYQALGGDATQLAPKELLDQGLEVLLNNAGVPIELYKGSLQIQSAPAALRLFESSWSHLNFHLNHFLRFVMKKLSGAMEWEDAVCKLEKVSHADDLQRQMAKMQLMVSGMTSKQTGLQSVGVDYFEEIKRQMEEQKYEAEQQASLTEDMNQAATMSQMNQPPQQGGAAPAPGAGGAAPAGGGAPPPGGAAAGSDPTSMAMQSSQASMPTMMQKPTTPQEMLGKAQTLAQQILSMPESQKDSELIQLKKQDPVMHSLVTSQLQNIKQQAQTAGGSMLLQQQFGKQGSVKKSRYIKL